MMAPGERTTTASFDCVSERETLALAAALASNLRSSDVIVLDGPLGSGKTCFTRGMAMALGVSRDVVSSPTFVICQEYTLQESDTHPFTTMAHIDAYRLSSSDELHSIGFDELLDDPNVLIVIEWPERVADAIPVQRSLRIDFEHLSETGRTLRITAAAARTHRIRAFWEDHADRIDAQSSSSS